MMTRVRCVLLISRLLALEAVNTRSCRVDAAASASHAVAGGGGDSRRTSTRRNRPKVLVQPDTGEAERGEGEKREGGGGVWRSQSRRSRPHSRWRMPTETSVSAAPGWPSHPAGRRKIYGQRPGGLEAEGEAEGPPAGSGRSCQGATVRNVRNVRLASNSPHGPCSRHSTTLTFLLPNVPACLPVRLSD